MVTSSTSQNDAPSAPTTLAQRLATDIYQNAGGESLSAVIQAIAASAVIIEKQTRLAALAGILGATGEINIQQELVQHLDSISTDIFVKRLRDCQKVSAIACEELEGIVHFSNDADHEYLAVFDPVDGSSNIDVAVTIGSIFGIYRRIDDGPVTEEVLLRPGREQIAALYVIYGSSTVLILAVANHVDGFTFNPSDSHFVLSHSDIKIPAECKYYSLNEHYQERWAKPMQDAVSALRRKYGQRYVGSLVADFHRDLLKGGVFLYPGEELNPQGKLRLVYEANPLSFIAKQAGGAASNGTERILDLQPKQLHERTPLIIGNRDVVEEIEKSLK